MWVASIIFFGALIALVTTGVSTDDTAEKGTPGSAYTQEMHRFLEIDRSIEFVKEPLISTPSPTPTPEPTQAPTPTQASTPTPYVWVSSTPEIIYDAICNQGLAWDCQQALNIAWCESKWQPWRINPSGATGLFQVMLPLWSKYMGGDPLDPYVNSRAAYAIYLERNSWSHWACYPV